MQSKDVDVVEHEAISEEHETEVYDGNVPNSPTTCISRDTTAKIYGVSYTAKKDIRWQKCLHQESFRGIANKWGFGPLLFLSLANIYWWVFYERNKLHKSICTKFRPIVVQSLDCWWSTIYLGGDVL